MGTDGNPYVGNRFILSAQIEVDSPEDGYMLANITYLEPTGTGQFDIEEGVLVKNKGSSSISKDAKRAATGARKRTVNKVKKRLNENR